jgi:hypothetical protein
MLLQTAIPALHSLSYCTGQKASSHVAHLLLLLHVVYSRPTIKYMLDVTLSGGLRRQG